MALLKASCWALIFMISIRLPPVISLVTILKNTHYTQYIGHTQHLLYTYCIGYGHNTFYTHYTDYAQASPLIDGGKTKCLIQKTK